MMDTYMAELATLFEVEPSAIDPDALLETFENWDSLTKVSLVALFQDRTGIVLESDQVDAFVTVGDVLRFLTSASETLGL